MEKKPILNEDWSTNLLGLLTIVALLGGLQLPTPADDWKTTDELLNRVLSTENLIKYLQQFFYAYALMLLGFVLMRKPLRYIVLGFPVIYLLTWFALVLTGNGFMSSLKLEVVIFSLIIGLVLSNLFTVPHWLKASLSTEFFVKTGLVLLGSSVIFDDILQAGGLGLLQALIVVLGVWYFAWWVCKKLGVDEEMRMILASAVSICGVSAAIATAGAIKGDPKKLSYIISLVLVIAIPMMLGMPYLAQFLGLSPEATGAWLGGTIDTSGAVVASGTLAGEVALQYSTIVKFSQNVLLGLAAFAISVYWTYTHNNNPDGEVEKPTLKVIWERFPKFILGFLAASLLFSFVFDAETAALLKSPVKNLRDLWFALAFVSIGLETRFGDLFSQKNSRPLYAFLIAQLFNILLTLIVAYLLFNA